MGCLIVSPSIRFQFCFFFFFIHILFISSNASIVSAGDSKEASVPQNENSFGAVATSESSPLSPVQPQPQPPPPPLTDERPLASPLRPSTSVIVGVSASMFSIIFLLILYAKHCKPGTVVVVHGYSGNTNAHYGGRKNSGIDRAVIESLPIFRFASLSGQKNGLECAVCLTQFEPTEVLRLLPKCKHAFHVECADTWLDAHSTCPLCRYRVDPEDILLVEDPSILSSPASSAPSNANHETGTEPDPKNWVKPNPETRSTSGRHSSAGERCTGLLQRITQRPGESEREPGHPNPIASFRRSVDSAASLKRKSESVALGCFDRPRKDGLLLNEMRTTAGLEPRRLEHRILVSPSGYHDKQRWSDVQTSDLLYLRSEMLITDSRRLSLSSSSGCRAGSGARQNAQLPLHSIKIIRHPQCELPSRNMRSIDNNSDKNSSTSTSSTFLDDGNTLGGRSVINVRSVSEITGLSRYLNRGGSRLIRGVGALSNSGNNSTSIASIGHSQQHCC